MVKQYDEVFVVETLSEHGTWIPNSVYEGRWYAEQGAKIKASRYRLGVRVSSFRRAVE